MRSVPHRVGLYFGVVQFFFTLTWTVYVIFLPRLAAEVGIPKQYVPYILMVDQIIFVVMDYTMGVAADRAAHVLGRVGTRVLAVTIASCVAFLLIPFVAPQGSALMFVVLLVVWAATSSALRAPPLVLLGRHVPQPQVPWLSGLSLFGLGAAGAVGPYLTLTLREMDPRIPFVLSSLAVALATMGIVWAEQTLARSGASSNGAREKHRPEPGRSPVLFLSAVLLLAIGFQVHLSLNSAALYAKVLHPPQIERVMPLFWVGFGLVILPASKATARFGGIAVAGAGGMLAALAAWTAAVTENPAMLITMQLLAGAGWALVLMSAVSAAIAIGHVGREGMLTGGVFALLALAAFGRIAVVALGLANDPAYAPLFTWLPVVAWGAGGLVLLFMFARMPALQSSRSGSR
jgi:hypothetical protein